MLERKKTICPQKNSLPVVATDWAWISAPHKLHIMRFEIKTLKLNFLIDPVNIIEIKFLRCVHQTVFDGRWRHDETEICQLCADSVVLACSNNSFSSGGAWCDYEISQIPFIYYAGRLILLGRSLMIG